MRASWWTPRRCWPQASSAAGSTGCVCWAKASQGRWPTVNHASAKAKAAIETAGGSITLIERKVLAADEAKRKKTAAKKAKTGKSKPAASEE
jgi:hypothetical protein